MPPVEEMRLESVRSKFLDIATEIRLKIYAFISGDSEVYFESNYHNDCLYRASNTMRHQTLIAYRQCYNKGLVLSME